MLKKILEKAYKQENMQWRVYSFDPEKDNELVYTSKAFDCIADAQVDKVEQLKKHPNYVVEISTTVVEESANIDVKNPGVLEVPDGKKVDELPQSHFEKLVDEKGYAEVIRALTNLEVWNKDKNKSLSSWASNMADKLKKKFRPESAQKDLANQLLQVLSKSGATLRQLQDLESRGYSDKDLSDTLKDLIQQKKIKTSFEGGALRYTLTESAQKLTYNDIGIGDRYKLSNGKILQVYDMGPDYIRVKINGQLQSEQSPEDFDSLKLVGTDMSESTQKNEDTFKVGDIACTEKGNKVKILDRHPGLAGHGDPNPSYICKVKALYGAGHAFSIEEYKLSKCNESAQKNEGKGVTINGEDNIELDFDTRQAKVYITINGELTYKVDEDKFMQNVSDFVYNQVDKDKTKFKLNWDKHFGKLNRFLRKVESAQKNEDYKKPKSYDELKAGEWYKFNGEIRQIADRQPIDNEIQTFKVFPDLHVGNGTHAAYKSLFKPTDFVYVDKRELINKAIKERESQIAKLKLEIDALKKSL